MSGFWSARTCSRFQSGDMSPQSKSSDATARHPYRATKSSSAISLFSRLTDVIERMVVQNVLVNAGDVRVVIIYARINIKRDDRKFVVHEHGFRLLEKCFAFLHVGLRVACFDQRIIFRAFPSGAIVAAVALK